MKVPYHVCTLASVKPHLDMLLESCFFPFFFFDFAFSFSHACALTFSPSSVPPAISLSQFFLRGWGACTSGSQPRAGSVPKVLPTELLAPCKQRHWAVSFDAHAHPMKAQRRSKSTVRKLLELSRQADWNTEHRMLPGIPQVRARMYIAACEAGVLGRCQLVAPVDGTYHSFDVLASTDVTHEAAVLVQTAMEVCYRGMT